MYGGTRYLETFPDTPANKEWGEAYRAKYNQYPTNWSWQNAAAWMFLDAAAKKADTLDCEAGADALTGLTIDSPFGINGKLTMRDDHTIIDYAIGWGKTIPNCPTSWTSSRAIGARSPSWRPSGRSRCTTPERHRVDLDALGGCVVSPACLVTQTTSGLIAGMLLFLVAAGLTLIFGVLKVVNFAHGTFYMLGGYVAYTVMQQTGNYGLSVIAAGLAMAVFGVFFERALIARVYGQDVLMQLLVCYAVVLICDDVVKLIWGADFLAMGMPPAFQVPPLFIAGGIVPPFYLVLIVIALLIAAVLALGLATPASARSSPRPRTTRAWSRRWASTPMRCSPWSSRLAAGWPGSPAGSPRRCAR